MTTRGFNIERYDGTLSNHIIVFLVVVSISEPAYAFARRPADQYLYLPQFLAYVLDDPSAIRRADVSDVRRVTFLIVVVY